MLHSKLAQNIVKLNGYEVSLGGGEEGFAALVTFVLVVTGVSLLVRLQVALKSRAQTLRQVGRRSY